MPMSIPAASGCTTSRLISSAWIFRANSLRCFRFVGCGARLGLVTAGDLAGFRCFFFGGPFMLSYPRCLGSTRLGPVGEKYTISPAGSSPGPFSRSRPPPYTQSPNTGATLTYGHKRAKEKRALTAEPRCHSALYADCIWMRTLAEFLTRVTTPARIAGVVSR